MSLPPRDQNAASDTFLSRVFGLHSIYNQLDDNYQFYDPKDDEASNHLLELLPLMRPVHSNLAQSQLQDTKGGDLPLERPPSLGDLEFLLDSDTPPSPLLIQTDGGTRLFNNLLSESRYLSSDATAQPFHNVEVPENPHLQHLYQNVEHNSEDGPKRLLWQLPANRMFHGRRSPDIELGLQPELSNRRNLPQHTAGSVAPRSALSRPRVTIPPKERALYLWANIVNMDEFLVDVYYYYRGRGFGNIVVGRVVELCILVFILGFTTFLRWGVDYAHFFHGWNSNSNVPLTLADLVIPGFFWTRVPFLVKFLLFGFAAYIGLRVVQLYFDYAFKLTELQNFYRQLLGINDDAELMTIAWLTIVERLMLLRDYNSLTALDLPPHFVNDLNSKVRLNAHDIANRIMRKENYFIALVNKDILDLNMHVPGFLRLLLPTHSVLTRTLEWNLKLCIDNFIFNSNGQINPAVLQELSRNQLALELSSRFRMAALINLFLCPFIVVYFVLLYFFRYFNEYKSNPSSLVGLRQFTPWAEWKLREFNELPHFFLKRLHLAIGPCNTYINQFPSGFLVVNVMTFVNFVAGAVTAVLVLMGLFFDDEEHNFWLFELSKDRSALFYISVFGTIWAVTLASTGSSTATSLENINTQGVSFFYDPEASLRYALQFTHYLPSSWNGRLHTVGVKNEFCELYCLKIIVILNEILSLVLTPFVLWFRVSQSSSAIIDFFRDYSIHVDGLGYVCYFAMFNFEEKDKNMMASTSKPRRKKKKPAKARHSDGEESDGGDDHLDAEGNDDPEVRAYYQDDKMIKSYMYFLESYGGDKTTKKATPSARKPKQEARRSPVESIFESQYGFTTRFEPPEAKRKGVLGMINQFSRQDAGRS